MLLAECHLPEGEKSLMTNEAYEFKISKLVHKISTTYYFKRTINLDYKIREKMFSLLNAGVEDIDNIVFRCNDTADKYAIIVCATAIKNGQILQRFEFYLILSEERRNENDGSEVNNCVA